MKLKKVLALVLSAALVVSAFAGCGGNSSSSTASTESSTASESSAESTESTASGDSTPAASGDSYGNLHPEDRRRCKDHQPERRYGADRPEHPDLHIRH